MVADADSAEYLGVGAKLDVVANRRHGATLMTIADRHALAQGAVGADHHLGVNKDIAEMPDPQAVRQAIIVPEPSEEIPFIGCLLQDFARSALTLDPWSLTLPTEPAP